MGQTDHKIYVDGLCLKGYLYSMEGEQGQWGGSTLLLLCHGIPAAPQSAGREVGEKDGGYPALAASCLQEGFNVFHFNFRGTGDSEGNFDLAGWRRDLTSVLDYWEKEGGINTFLLWGFSAGAAVSCCVAARDSRVKALVMAASPAEFAGLFPAGEQQRLLAVMRQRGIIRNGAFPPDAACWLQDIHAASPLTSISAIAPRPLLIIHGEEDELVSCSHAIQLYRAAGDGAELIILPEAGHQLRRHPPAVNCCLRWLKNKIYQTSGGRCDYPR
jgi:putative redox protein